MHTILLFLLLVSGAFALSCLIKSKIEFTIPIWLCFIMVWLYLFGLFQLLIVGLLLLFAISVASVGYFVYTLIQNKKDAIQYLKTPGLLIFAILFGLFCYANNGRLISIWDEYSQWGLLTKSMVFFDALRTNAPNTGIFPNYLPGTQIIQYIFCKIYGSVTEGRMIFATEMFTYSMFLPWFAELKYKNVLAILSRIAIIFLLPTIFFGATAFSTILVDTTMAIVFASLVYYCFAIEDETLRLIALTLQAAALCLIKDFGLVLAIIAVMIFFIDSLFLYNSKWALFKEKKSVRPLLPVLLPIAGIVFVKVSWKIYLSILNIDTAVKLKGNLLSLLFDIFIKHNMQDYQYTSIKNFATGIFTQPIAISLNSAASTFYILTIICGMAFLFLIFHAVRAQRNRYISLSIVMYLGLGVYTFGILLTYLFIFLPIEAINLAGYPRYMATWFLAMFLIAIMLLYRKQTRIKSKSLTTAATGILVAVLLVSNFNVYKEIAKLTLAKEISVNKTIEMRAPYQSAEKLIPLLKDNKKIGFLSITTQPNNGGYDYFVNRYMIAPYDFANRTYNFYSIGTKPYFDGDIWTNIMTVEEFAEYLKDKDYVYIQSTNDAFKSDYSVVFDGGIAAIKDRALFKIIVDHGDVKLHLENSF